MNYLYDQSQKRFLKTLCGKFSNAKQSEKEPSLYSNINIYFRLLPWEIFEGISIYTEQSYNHSPWSPYRQAVLRLSAEKDLFVLYNYKIVNQDRIAGAGFNLEFLKMITLDKLHIRENCELIFKEKLKGYYDGCLKECKKCIVKMNGKDTYLISQIRLSEEKLSSKDEGFDIKTNKKVWGSMNGFLEFDRIQ